MASVDGGGRRSWSSRGYLTSAWWFALPALAFYAFVTIVPAARGVLDAFTNSDGMGTPKQFVGLDNFVHIFSDETARAAIWQTLVIAVAVTVLQNVIGLLLALGVKSRIKGRRILSVIFFAPAIVTPLIMAYLWKYLYAPDGGIASLLDTVGLKARNLSWLGDYHLALWSVIIVIVWQFAGYSMVIFMAGLESIPETVMEAAQVDGAGPLRTFFWVQLPLLGPALTISVMLSIIGGLKQFDVVWVMTGGGPGTATQTISTLIFQYAFQYAQYGYSVALALVLTVIALPLSSLQYRAVAGTE